MSSRCRDRVCEACGVKHQQVQGERTVTSPGAGDLPGNSYPTHLRRWFFRSEQNCALQDPFTQVVGDGNVAPVLPYPIDFRVRLSLSSNLSHSLNYIHCCNYLSLTPSPLLVLISLSCISALSLSLCASFFSLVSIFYSFPVLCVLLLISFHLITLLREEKKNLSCHEGLKWASSWWGLYYLVNLWTDFNPCSYDRILLNLLHAFFSQASYFLFFLSRFHTRWCRFRFAFLVHVTPLYCKSTQVKILDIHFCTHVQESVKQSWYCNPWYKKINRNVDWRSCLFWRVTAGELAR